MKLLLYYPPTSMATFSTHVDEWSCGLTSVSALVDKNSHFAALVAASPSMHPCAAAFDKYSDCSSSGSESTDNIHGTSKGAFARKVGVSSMSTAATDVPSSSGEDTASWSLPLTQDSSISDCCSDSDEDVDLSATDSIVYPVRVLLQLRASVSTRAALAPSVVYGTRRIDTLQCDHRSASSTTEATTEIAPSVSSLKKKRNSLPSSSTSWSAQRAGVSSSISDDASVERASRSILNKITIEKFDSLYEQLATCGVSTPEHIKILMREVFEKATVQHHFIGMYADLCVRLEADPRLAPAMGAVGEPTSFRHLLLHQCQVAFEQLLEPRAEDANEGDLTLEAKEEQELLRKRRALGNVKFVGQLMVRGMLSSRLLVACSDALLRGQTTCPEALESLAALLTVAGKKFDGRSDWQYSDRLDAIFGRLRELTKDKMVSARVRFLLRDLLELRESGWPEQGRPAVAKEGPMRLEEVKERAAEEVCQKTVGASASSRQHRGSKSKENKAVVTARLDTLQRIVSNNPKTPADKISGPSQQSKQSNGNASHQKVKEQQQQAKGTSSGKKQVREGGKGRNSAAAPCLLSMAQAAPAPEHAAGGRQDRNEEQKKLNKIVVAQPDIPPMAVAGKPEASVSAEVATVATVVPQTSAVVTPAPPVVVAFSLKMFKRELSATLKELSSERNVAAAVRRIRAQNVPTSHHATEFTDLLTRAAEETRGPARRSAFAFAAGLAAADPSCFDRAECINGAREFFAEVYQELCSEVPRLPAIAASELVPTLRSVFPASALNEILPQELRAL